MSSSIILRGVTESDNPIFFEQQLKSKNHSSDFINKQGVS